MKIKESYISISRMIDLDRIILYNKMIPVDIDNFIVESINIRQGNYVVIKGNIRKIPREIGNCSYLKNISFYNNIIVDITALSNCSSLKYLSLYCNLITNISALSSCYSLEQLSLDYNRIVDISNFSSGCSLKYLSLYGNKIKNKITFNPNVTVYY